MVNEINSYETIPKGHYNIFASKIKDMTQLNGNFSALRTVQEAMLCTQFANTRLVLSHNAMVIILKHDNIKLTWKTNIKCQVNFATIITRESWQAS